MERNLIQIAGVIDEVEARMLQECGVSHIGFPLRLSIHQEDLTEAEAAGIIRRLNPCVHSVLITYLSNAVEILHFSRFLGVRIVQLHGNVTGRELEKLKTLDSTITVVKSLVVGLHPESVLHAMMKKMSPFVDAFLLDTYDPETGASGATGRTHDWRISRRLVECSRHPVILAGGLTAENVRDAVLEVEPAGVDSHTGVEGAAGRKSREKVERFIAEARSAFRTLEAPGARNNQRSGGAV